MGGLNGGVGVNGGSGGSSSPSSAQQLARSDTPGLPTANPAPSGGGGKLLLSRELVTSSLIQPGSVPGGAGAQSENEKVYVARPARL